MTESPKENYRFGDVVLDRLTVSGVVRALPGTEVSTVRRTLKKESGLKSS
jgi:hypothetical protein